MLHVSEFQRHVICGSARHQLSHILWCTRARSHARLRQIAHACRRLEARREAASASNISHSSCTGAPAHSSDRTLHSRRGSKDGRSQNKPSKSAAALRCASLKLRLHLGIQSHFRRSLRGCQFQHGFSSRMVRSEMFCRTCAATHQAGSRPCGALE